MLPRHGGFCWLSIFPRTLIYPQDSYTSRIRPLGREYRPRLLPVRTAVGSHSMRELHGRDALSIRGSTNLVAIEVHHYRPSSINVSGSLSCLCRIHSRTYPVDKVKNQPHHNAELFKVQFPIPVYITKIPHLLQLIVPQSTIS